MIEWLRTRFGPARLLGGRVNTLLVAIVLAAFAAVGLLGAASVRETARLRVGDSHRFALDSLEYQLKGRIERVTLDARGLAELNVTRQYALAAQQSELRNVAGRADVVREFLRVLDRHPDSYLAIRYVAPNGETRIETMNALESSVMTPLGEGRAFAGDPLLARVLAGRPGEVFVGTLLRQVDDASQPLRPPQALLRVATPVRFFDTAQNVLGAVIIDVRGAVVLDAVSSAPGPGQRLLLLNREGQIIADSDDPLRDYLLEAPPDTGSDFARNAANETPANAAVERQLAALAADALAQDAGGYLASVRSLDNLPLADAPLRLVLLETPDALREANETALVVLVGALVAGAGVSAAAAWALNRTAAPIERARRLAAQLAEQGAAGRLAGSPDDLAAALSDISARLTSLSAEMERQRQRLAYNMELATRIAREAAMLRDLDALVNRVLALVCNEFGYDHAQVFLLDDAGAHAVLVYSHGAAGARLLAAGLKVPVGSASAVGRVTASGRPLALDGLDSSASDDGLLPGMRARLVTPLYAESAVSGALDVQSASPQPFGEFEVQALTLLAGQLTLALHNARLMMQAEQRGRELEALNRQRIRAAWEGAETRFSLERAYSYDLRRVVPEARPPLPLAVSVPIRIGAEVVGTLDAAPPDGQPFSDDEQIMMRAVADRLALALENARLFQETQLSLRETSALYELNRRLNEAESLPDIIRAVIETVIPQAAGGQILTFDNDIPADQPEALRLIAAWPDADGSGPARPERLQIGAHPFLQALQPDRVTVVNDIARDARLDDQLKHIFRTAGAAALAVVPLNVRGLWRGVLTLEFPAPRAFTEQEGRIYTALIDQAGVAVDNRLLLRQTEMTLAQIERLYGASRAINTAQSMLDLVQAVVATSNDARLDYALSLLEGDLDAKGWPTRERLVARTQSGEVYEHNRLYGLLLPATSPMRSREPVVLEADDAAWPLVAALRADGARYCAVFPLFSANQPVALFYVLAYEPYEMTLDDYEVYVALAGQMSTVLQNRRLLDQTAQALDETRRLYAASRAISEAADSQAVYLAAAAHLSAVAERVSRVQLLLAWPEPSLDAPFLEYAFVWTPAGVDEAAAGQRVRAADTPYLRLAAGGQAQQFDNVDRDLAGDQDALQTLRAEGAVSMVVAPLRSRNKWLGALVCHSDRPQAFGEADTRFVQAVADQVALAVENRQLFAEAQAEARRALALAEAGQLAARIGADFARSISEVYATVAEAAGYDRWLLALRPDDSPHALEVVVQRGLAQTGLDVGSRLDVERSEHILARAARQRQAIVANNPAADSALSAADQAAAGKRLSAPVVVGDQVLGALLVGRPLHEADLTERDVQLVITLASQVAVAVENRRLFRAVEAERQTLRSILDTMPAGVLVLDAATLRPTEFNARIESLLGRPVDPNRPFSADDYQFFRTSTSIRYTDRDLPIFVAAQTGAPASIDDLVALHDDGEQVDLLMSAAPIRDSSGSISAIVTAIEDIGSLRSLESALQENLSETIALFEATRALSEAASIDDVLDTLLAQLVTIEPDEAAVVIYDAASGQTHVARALVSNPADLTLPAPLLPDRPVMVSDAARSSYLNQADRAALAQTGARALATFPLRAPQRNEPLGWLVLFFAAAHDFTPREERFLTTLADSGGVALDNRYLFASTQRALHEASTLYRASRALADAAGPADVLQAAVEHLATDTTSLALLVLLDAPDWNSNGARAEVAACWAADGSADLLGAEFTPESFPAWPLLAGP
ncbi:MAG: GAF domain-containing protein, partial [Aggregatilineales bacterium]